MNKPWRTRAEAEREIEDAAAWYEQREQGLGEQFADAIAAALRRLSEQPWLAGPLPKARRGSRVRRYLMRRFPYALIILELEHEYQVLAVAHLKRRPGYWRRRLREADE